MHNMVLPQSELRIPKKQHVREANMATSCQLLCVYAMKLNIPTYFYYSRQISESEFKETTDLEKKY